MGFVLRLHHLERRDEKSASTEGDVALTEGGEVVEDDGLVDIVADSADEDGFLGLGAFLHTRPGDRFGRWTWPSTDVPTNLADLNR